MDELDHLAKVRVAGSNPVFRSIVAGQRLFSQPPSLPSSRPANRKFPRIIEQFSCTATSRRLRVRLRPRPSDRLSLPTLPLLGLLLRDRSGVVCVPTELNDESLPSVLYSDGSAVVSRSSKGPVTVAVDEISATLAVATAF